MPVPMDLHKLIMLLPPLQLPQWMEVFTSTEYSVAMA